MLSALLGTTGWVLLLLAIGYAAGIITYAIVKKFINK